MTPKPDLSALISSRICHDLISPIGAIGNGVELLLIDGSAKGPELAMISESVSNANARIRFFRVAFGASGSDQRIARTEAQSILSDLTKGGRLRITWQSGSDLARREVKIVFLAIQCLETAMPWGGAISITQTDDQWTVTGEAARLKLDPALWEGLSASHTTAEITPALVHFALIPQEIQRQSRHLTVDLRETVVCLSF